MVVVSSTCKLGQGQSQCRYLAGDERRGDVFYCLKTRPQEKEIIDGEVEASANNANRKENSILPKGDNCDGFIPEAS